MKKNVIFLTGASGFVGGNLAKLLVEKEYFLRCLIRDKNKFDLKNHPSVEIIEGDLFSLDKIEKGIKDCDYIIHIAGLVASKRKKDFFDVNVNGTKNIIDAALKNKINLKRFILISSLAAVGPSKNNIPVDENTIPHPITTYGKSKLAAENMLLKEKINLPIIILRPSAVFGENDSATIDFFKMLNYNIFPVMGSFNNKVNMIYVQDLCNGIILAMENEKSIGETFLIASENNYSWNEISANLEKKFGKKFFKILIPKYLVFILGCISGLISKLKNKPSVLDCEKAIDLTTKDWSCSNLKSKSILGFSEKSNLAMNLKNTFDWYKTNKLL